MKDKRMLYVLLPAVVVIWGLIFQRIWSAAQGPGDEATVGLALPSASAAPTLPPRPPQLLLTYTEPFRANPTAGAAVAPAVAPAAAAALAAPSGAGRVLPSPALNLPVAPVPTSKVPVVWPVVQYRGFIDNPRVDRRVAMLTLGTQEVMMKAGERRQDVTLVRVFRDSVQLRFQGEQRMLKRAAVAGE